MKDTAQTFYLGPLSGVGEGCGGFLPFANPRDTRSLPKFRKFTSDPGQWELYPETFVRLFAKEEAVVASSAR
jgi:hypothetical protein